MWCAKLLTMTAITFTWADADFERRAAHSSSEMGQSRRFGALGEVRFSPLNRTYAELWLQSAIGRDRATKGTFECTLRRDSQRTRADRSVGAMAIRSAKHAQGAKSLSQKTIIKASPRCLLV